MEKTHWTVGSQLLIQTESSRRKEKCESLKDTNISLELDHQLVRVANVVTTIIFGERRTTSTSIK